MKKNETLGETLSKTKVKVSNLVTTVKRVVHNSERFLQATALLLVTVFGVLNYKTIDNQVYRYALVVSLVIVGLRAFYELVRFLDRD